MGRREVILAEEAARPTQQRYPWRAAIRTFVAVGIPTFLSFAAIVPEALSIILAQFGAVLPDGARAALIGVAAVITGVALIITRIMALPKFVEFQRKHMRWLAPDDKAPQSERVVAG